MSVSPKGGLIISGAALLFRGIALVLVMSGKDKQDIQEEGPDERIDEVVEVVDVTTVVYSVTDYKDGEAVDSIVATYSSKQNAVTVERNGEETGLGVDLDGGYREIIELNPFGVHIGELEDSIDKQSLRGSVSNTYNMYLDTTERYIADLINSGDKTLVRLVGTAGYAEAYLEDYQGTITRIVATEDRMIEAEMSNDVKLKNITDYFTGDGGNNNEE